MLHLIKLGISVFYPSLRTLLTPGYRDSSSYVNGHYNRDWRVSLHSNISRLRTKQKKKAEVQRVFPRMAKGRAFKN